jgi:hypothetical protein
MRWRGLAASPLESPIARRSCVARPATGARNPPEAPTARLSQRSGVSPGRSPFPAAAAGARNPPEEPVTRPFQRSGVSPGRFPFPTVRAFLLPHAGAHKSYPALNSRFFSRPHEVHRKRAVIPRPRRFSTAPSTALSTRDATRDHAGHRDQGAAPAPWVSWNHAARRVPGLVAVVGRLCSAAPIAGRPVGGPSSCPDMRPRHGMVSPY